MSDRRSQANAQAGHGAGGLDLSRVFAQSIDWQYKAFPVVDPPVSIGSVEKQGWNALAPPFLTPVMVLKDTALQHNIDLMAAYCSARRVSLAPHAKTLLSPQIADRQLAAGAWGLTVATAQQARVLRSVGAQRILLANQLIDAGSISWLARELNHYPDLEIYCLVDSAQGATILDRYLTATGLRGHLPVLIELGIPGGRCGCRSPADGRHLAQTVSRLENLRLVGVETYENMFPQEGAEQITRHVDEVLDRLRELATGLDAEHLFHKASEILISAGGSLWFDRVAAKLTGSWSLSRPVRTVVRAGAYVTHATAQYQKLSPLDGRSASPRRLMQALELWAAIVSRPEPDLAVLNFGKRDAAYDWGYPTPFRARMKDGLSDLPPGAYEILSLNDQHARMRLPADSPINVGDLVGSYISHPCTSFDNWRLVPLVDDRYKVIGAVRSFL
jgi:D-serine dehydratase